MHTLCLLANVNIVCVRNVHSRLTRVFMTYIVSSVCGLGHAHSRLSPMFIRTMSCFFPRLVCYMKGVGSRDMCKPQRGGEGQEVGLIWSFSLLILTFLAAVRTMGGAVGGPMMAGKGVKVCWCVCWCWCMCWCWWNSALRSDIWDNGEPVAPGADPRPRSELWTRKRLFSSCRRRSWCSEKKEGERKEGEEKKKNKKEREKKTKGEGKEDKKRKKKKHGRPVSLTKRREKEEKEDSHLAFSVSPIQAVRVFYVRAHWSR